MHVEGRRVCAVCARVLDYSEATGWMHSVGSHDPDEWDHLPVPVEDTEVQVRDRCDFCFGDVTVWVLPARTFVTPGGGSVSEGDWGACDPCAELIQRNDWNGLMRRVKGSWEDRHGPMSPQVEASLRAMYRRLRKNITGGLRRIEEER